MGSSFAPSISNLFMVQLEDRHILNKDSNPFFKDIILFYRCIDDCFCIYSNIQTLQAFSTWLNTLHPNIKFTSEIDKTQISFLDTTVYKNNQNQLSVKPFVKKNDMNTYLHFQSHHPRHLRANIPYCQFLHIKRNATDQTQFQHSSRIMHHQFLRKGYPNGIVAMARMRVEQRDWEDLFKDRPQEDRRCLHAAFDYTPYIRPVINSLKKH